MNLSVSELEYLNSLRQTFNERRWCKKRSAKPGGGLQVCVLEEGHKEKHIFRFAWYQKSAREREILRKLGYDKNPFGKRVNGIVPKTARTLGISCRRIRQIRSVPLRSLILR